MTSRPRIGGEARRLQMLATEHLQAARRKPERAKKLMDEARALIRAAMDADGITTRWRGSKGRE